MIEKEVVVATKHGAMPTFAACPDGLGQFPGIIFYMDAPGIREELRNMARRIAKHGYFCLLPDMYYRLGTCHFDIPRRDDGMSAVIRAAMNHLTNARVVDDTAALLAWFDASDRARSGTVGCVGHCMSGQYITRSRPISRTAWRGRLALWRRHRHRQGRLAAPAARQDQGRALLRLCRDRPGRPRPYPRRSEKGARQGRRQT
jgi:hypothetical protein